MGYEQQIGNRARSKHPIEKGIVIDLLISAGQAKTELEGWKKNLQERRRKSSQESVSACERLVQHLIDKFGFSNGSEFMRNPSNLEFWNPLIERYPPGDPLFAGMPYAPLVKPFQQLRSVCCDAPIKTINEVIAFCRDVEKTAYRYMWANYMIH